MKKLLMILMIAGVTLAGCSKTKKFSKRLTGKWNIATKIYDEKINNVASASSFNTTGVGSIELKSDGTGTIADPTRVAGATINYTVTDWFTDDVNITLMLKDQNGSETQVTYTSTSNEKDKQTWVNKMKYQTISGTIESNTTYNLTLAE